MQTKSKNYVTENGLDELRREYEKLTKVQRAEIIARLQQTREMGDLTESSAYDEAREAQSLLESRITEIERLLKNVVVVSRQAAQDFAVIGSRVIVEIDGQVDEFTIVGSAEADPARRKISNESPVGAALLGTRPGETVEVATPIIRAQYKILEIK